MRNFYEDTTILFKIVPYGYGSFSINEFLSLFLPDGPFAKYEENLFGVATNNFKQRISVL